MEYQSAIFDLDGTILESSGSNLSWLHDAVRDVLSNHGCDDDLPNSRLEVLAGLGSKSDFVNECESLGVEQKSFWLDVEDARARRKIQFVESGGIKLCDGAEELLQHLRDNDVRLGLISNSPDPSVDLLLRHFDLDRYFHFYRGVTGLDDLGMEKPNPVHIEMAMSELGREPFVYIGDSSVDVDAAERAGIDSMRVSKDSDLTKLKGEF